VQMLAFDLWHENQGNFIPVEKDLEDLAVHFRDHADLFVDFFHQIGQCTKQLPWPILSRSNSARTTRCQFHRHDEGQTCRHVGIAQGSGTASEGDANLSDTPRFSD